MVSLAVALGAGTVLLALVGCSNREVLHPAFRLEEKDYERAVERGRSLVSCGDDPYRAYSRAGQDVSLRVSPDVVVRQAACCWPKDEIAFAIAKQGDASDVGVARAAKQARKRVQREVKFSVVLQMPKARDPATISFQMRSSVGQVYPPIAVETPVYLRDVSSALDPDMPAAALYSFDVHFPIRGSPGYPPIGPEVSYLQLIVEDGDSQATVDFPMPQPQYRY